MTAAIEAMTSSSACSANTTLYLHLSHRHLRAAANPLDQITIRSHSASRKRPENYQA